MKSKVFIALFLVISSIFYNGCSVNRNIDNSENRKEIDFIAKSRRGDYWNTVRAGAEAAAREFNVNLNYIAPDYEQDIDEQIVIMNKAIDRKVDSIVLAASDYNELVAVTEKAYDSKIPIIIVDSEVNTDKITSIIATDNYEAGRKLAEKSLELLKNRGKVAIVSYIKGSASAVKREEGVLSVLENQPMINVVAKEYSLSDEKLAEELTRKILNENEEINGFIALNGAASNGVANALEELKLADKIQLVAFDCTPEEIEYIDRGIIQATIVQNPFVMGYLGVKNAAAAARGREVPSNIDTGSNIIDKNNMYLPENQKLVFPFFR